jgi:large subunit ribosomal protein L10
MPLTRDQRLKSIEKLQKEFSEAKGIYVTDYSGINVAKMSGFRRNLRGAGVKYVVIKNSLAKIALEKCGKSEIASFLKGQVGVAVSSKDSIAPAKIIRDFRKENKDFMSVRAAYVDGTLFNEAQMNQLADLPSREVLLSQLLSCLQAPVAKMACTLNGILSKFVGTLEAVRIQKESQTAQ